jgi:hypothetical protein
VTTAATTDVDANTRRHRESVMADRATRRGDAKATTKPAASPEPSGNRWAALNAFVDAVLADATEAETRVWLVIFRDVKPGGLARIGMTDIACRTGMTRRAVVNAVAGLKKRGVIEVTSRGSINGNPNTYRVLAPRT